MPNEKRLVYWTRPARYAHLFVESIPLDPPRPERDDPAFRICGISEGEGRGVARAPESDDDE